MKKIILLIFFIVNSKCYSQNYIYRPLSNSVSVNQNMFNGTYRPIDPKTGLQKTVNGYNYYPTFTVPPIQSNGYTLQNTQPYVGQYYFNAEYWLFKW